MKASDYIAEFLAANGVQNVYEMCGGMTTHILDSLYRDGRVGIVSVHHEQAAAFAAEGAVRASGAVSVAMATSGPGATNLLTGVGSCFFDSVPVVFITGQVNVLEQRGDSGVRQSGFQETDIVAVATPITKAAWRVAEPGDIPLALENAFRVSREGRPGPVLVDIPMNVQRAEVDSAAPCVLPEPGRREPTRAEVDSVLQTITRAERPVVLAGGGVRAAGAAGLLREFVELMEIPVLCSLMGVDVLPFDHRMHAGMIGTYGNRWANLLLSEADLVLALGSRLDIRQTGAPTDEFRRGKTIVRVDVDPRELAWRITPDIGVEADVGRFLEGAIAHARSSQPSYRGAEGWLDRLVRLKAAWPDQDELLDRKGINPASLMHALSRAASDAATFVSDVGQNQMWAAQSLRLREGQRFLTSGGMGAMGFSLPAAIGAALAFPKQKVVAIAGDGGMQVNIQELETVARLGLPIKCVVLDNGCLGMVRQFQDEYMGSRYQSTVWGYGAPDFAKVSRAYGIRAETISEPAEVGQAVEKLLDGADAALLHVRLALDSVVRPKVSFGRTVFEMEPPPGGEQGGGIGGP